MDGVYFNWERRIEVVEEAEGVEFTCRRQGG